MPYEQKVDALEVYDFIKKFHDEYEQVPNVGFLAGNFKVTKRVIYNKLIALEKHDKIKRVKKNKYNTLYELTSN